MRKTGSIFPENLQLNWFVFPGKKYPNPVQFSTYSKVGKSAQFRFNFPLTEWWQKVNNSG